MTDPTAGPIDGDDPGEIRTDGAGASVDGAAPESVGGEGVSPEDLDWVTLDEDEEVLWSGKPHFYSIVPALVVGIPLSLFLVGIPIVLGAYLTRENTVFLLTTEGLYRKQGILSRDVQKIEFEKVQNISFSQGPLGNYFGYGNVDVSTAGGSGVEMQFRSVPDPRAVQERINREIRRSRSGSRSRGDEDAGAGRRRPADALDEILTELRAIRATLEERDAGDGDGDGDGEAVVRGTGDGDVVTEERAGDDGGRPDRD